MRTTLRKYTRGFTLIELLVVIAIIGLLAAIVLVSLQTSRQKARDARRVGDLAQVATALALYYDTARQFPLGAAGYCDLGTVLSAYISGAPQDPSDPSPCALPAQTPDAGFFQYEYYTPTGAVQPQEFLLRAVLENSGSPALRTDLDNTLSGIGPCNSNPTCAARSDGGGRWNGGALSPGEVVSDDGVDCGSGAGELFYCFRS